MIFLPIFAQGACRVADAEKGWHFIGKENLSGLAKGCNWSVLLLGLFLVALVGQSACTSSSDYQARQQLEQAAESLETGNVLEAAKLCRRVASGSARVEEAKLGFQTAMEQCLDAESPKTLQGAFQLLDRLSSNLDLPTLIPGESSDCAMNHVRAGQDIMEAEMAEAGFEKVEELSLLKDNHIVRFRSTRR